ncbi:MAG: hypothetical protein AVDCRST_MAG93-9668, partial [uncultured Chloroflexia bacterium]
CERHIRWQSDVLLRQVTRSVSSCAMSGCLQRQAKIPFAATPERAKG